MRPLTIIVGSILVTAGGLKLYGFDVATVGRVHWFAHPRVQLLAAEWELLLGVWLLSGWSRVLGWLATLVSFAVFALVSLYLAWIGEAHCDCFGPVKSSPWVTFALDCTVLSALTIFRPPDLGIGLRAVLLWRSALSAGTVVLVGSTTLVAVGAWAVARYGSIDAALAQIASEKITLDQSFVDFGTLEVGEKGERSIAVHNWTDKPIRIVGGKSTCAFGVALERPIAILPGQTAAIRVWMRPRAGMSGSLTHTAELWTDCRDQTTVRLTVSCLVCKPSCP
jgi:hypothetical protein